MATTHTPDPSWLDALAARDRAVHGELDEDFPSAEIRSLRERNAALAAALAQARHGVTIRERLLADLLADQQEANERAEAATARVTDLEAARDAAEAQVVAMTRSARWRAADAVVGVTRAPLAVARRLRSRGGAS